MREILFRGKREDNGQWVIGFLSKTRGLDNKLHICIDYEEKGLMCSSIVVPSTIGQYTGLTDKNGNKIFDGDIIKNHFEIGVVKFGSYETPYRDWSAITQDIFSKHIGFYINWITLDYRKDIEFWNNKIKVIGNIYDNPELLKEAEQE